MLEEKTDAEITDNYRSDHLYTHDFKDGGGKLFTIVSKDVNDVPDIIEYEHPFPEKVKVKTTFMFIKNNNEIRKIIIKRFRYYSRKGWTPIEEEISFSYSIFKHIISWMQLLDGLDLANINERRIALTVESSQTIDDDTQKKIRTLLLRKDGQKIIEELLNSGAITSTDIVNIGYRKKQLDVFSKLLHQEGYFDEYRKENGISDLRNESVWQHFFSSNNWIFGFGLDYRFLDILQKEAHVSGTDISGKGAVINDFLLGCNKFTVLVELKKADTPLFGKSKNRSNSWTLSEDLISAVSQILEQRASWQVYAETNANNNFNDSGETIKQRTFDPKSILIIGSTDQFSGDEKENQIKAKTFELFRRDSRNIEIVTYDELFERAKFIVEHRQIQKDL
jgi:hypothetical protein